MENVDPVLGFAPPRSAPKSYFEIKSTPPDEKRRAIRAAEKLARDEVYILMLTPFTPTPKICFDNVKLGTSEVRQLVIRNPGDAPLDVTLDRLPSEEKGFAIDYTCFRLGAKEETTLHIGWTPPKSGGVRDNILVKFGTFRSQIVLIGSCTGPDEKLAAKKPRASKPLGPKNLNVTAKAGRPSVLGSKVGTAKKVSIPANPVVRKKHSPEKRLIAADEPSKEIEAPLQLGSFDNRLPEKYTVETPTRRGTFVRERPPPGSPDVVESTPIQPKAGKIRDQDTRLSSIPHEFSSASHKVPCSDMMGPPIAIPSFDRRQTFVPSQTPKSSQHLDYGRYKKMDSLELGQEYGTNLRRETFLMPEESSNLASWTPQKLGVSERGHWGEIERLSLSHLKESNVDSFNESASSVHADELRSNGNTKPTHTNVCADIDIDEILNDCPGGLIQDINISTGHDDVKDVPTPRKLSPATPRITFSPCREQPLNLSVKRTGVRRSVQMYQPEVSDISLPESESAHDGLPPSRNHDYLPQSIKKEMRTLSEDASLAVNVSEYDGRREEELDAELVACERDSFHEELDRLAEARAASACRGVIVDDDEAVQSKRYSSGTVIKPVPTLDSSFLPDVSKLVEQELGGMVKMDLWSQQDKKQKQSQEIRTVLSEEVVCEQKVIVREEVIEENIEYEYEVIGDSKTLVSERNLGTSVKVKETETVLPSVRVERILTEGHVVGPVLEEEANLVECDISKLIEEQLSGPRPEAIPRSVQLSEDEIDGMIGVLSLEENASSSKPKHPALLSVAVESVALPGLKGSPRITNQNLKPTDNFLNKTVNETSFLPPNPDDPRRCSTGVKEKSKVEDPDQVYNVSGDVRKSLFAEQADKGPLAEQEDASAIPLSSGGYELPIVPDTLAVPLSSRLSSDTYIATADDSLQLYTIQEVEEAANTQSMSKNTFNKDKSAAGNKSASSASGARDANSISQQVASVSAEAKTPDLSINEEANTMRQTKDSARAETTEAFRNLSLEDKMPTSSVEKPPVLKERTPAKARRSNIKYVQQPIQAIATDPSSIPSEPTPTTKSGLNFIPLSNRSQQEKRKPQESVRRIETAKKVRPVALANVTRNPRVAAGKNPPPPRASLSAVKSVKTNSNARMSLGANIGSTRRESNRSVQPVQPARKLTLRHKSSSVVRHPNPFTAKNVYYDERWIEKQEKGFSFWLNFILTPQVFEEGESLLTPGKLDVAKLWTKCSQDAVVTKAPTREVMSMQAYTVRREMNRLRRSACKMWQSKEVATVIAKLEVEIEKLRLVIRKDRNICKDIGMKQDLLMLLLSYNPLWLRVGLETVYGELLPMTSNVDMVGLTRFLVTRLLSNPDILAEYAHPTVPHCYRDGYEGALKKFTLRKFFELVYFLDKAKQLRLIRHNPCLFCPDSKQKSTKDVLVTLAKDYLSGEGDIIKHLAYFGYKVEHQQTILDEFDYAVTNIGVDLRCGVRLTKVAEILTGQDLLKQLRVPAVSRLQKIHNTGVALKSLKASCKNYPIPTDIGVKDVVDGHREKTLSLLWSLVFGYQLSFMLDLQVFREECAHLRKSLKVRARLGNVEAEKGEKFLQEMSCRSPGPNLEAASSSADNEESLKLLKEWSQLVSAHYNIEVENWTVSWCDGRGLAALIHHYQPGLLDYNDISQETTLTIQSSAASLDDSLEFSYGNNKMDSDQYAKLLENEKKNFKLVISKVRDLGGVPIIITPSDMSNTIPDEKITLTFIAYLAVRLLDLSREIKAARVIQLAWRKRFAKIKEERLKVMNQAATVFQKCARAFLQRRRLIRYRTATITIQKFARGYLARRLAWKMRCEIKYRQAVDATITIQSFWRSVLARREAAARKRAICKLQAYARARIHRQGYLRLLAAVRLCQQRFRANRQAADTRQQFLQEKKSVLRIQACWRRYKAKQTLKETMRKIVKIQSIVRCRLVRKRFIILRTAVIKCQDIWRARKVGRAERSKYNAIRLAVIAIQARLRGRAAREQARAKLFAIKKLQAGLRGFLARKKLERLKWAANVVQCRWRAKKISQNERARFCEMRNAALVLQSNYRMLAFRRQFLIQKAAAKLIQATFRQYLARRRFMKLKQAVRFVETRRHTLMTAKRQRKMFLQLRQAAVVIQSCWKGRQIQRDFARQKSAALILQRNFRMIFSRRKYLQARESAVRIQAWYRNLMIGRSIRDEYAKQRQNAIIIQACWRMHCCRKKFLQTRRLSVAIQSQWRMILQRRRFKEMQTAASKIQAYYRAACEAKSQRSLFLQYKDSALKIQSYYRMYLNRKKYLTIKTKVTKVQSVVRMRLARQQYLKRKSASMKIQSWYRSILLGRHLRADYRTKLAKITRLQATWRMVRERRRYLALKKIVITIQAGCRRMLERKRYVTMKQSATAIQQWYRNLVMSRQLREQYLRERQKILTLQSYWRMTIQRRRYCNLQQKVTRLQASVRMMIQRRQFVRLKAAAAILQNRYRATLVGRKARSEYLTRRHAAILLQANYRCLIQRRRYVAMKKSTVLIQSRVRAVIAARNYANLKRSAVVIQARYRALVAGRQSRSQFEVAKRGVVALQALYRGRAVRRDLMKQAEAATVIQSWTRMTQQRKTFLALKQAVNTLQTFVRAKIEAKRCRNRFLLQKSCATKIQAWWRGHEARSSYLAIRNVIILLQSHVRKHQAFTAYSKLRQAAIFVQTRYRSKKLATEDRARFLEKRRSANTIQKYWRGQRARRQFSAHVLQVKIVQAQVRGYLARRQLAKLKQTVLERRSAIVIQCFFKRLMAQRELKKLRQAWLEKNAATKIQSLFRGYLVRRQVKRQTVAAVTLQKAWRSARLAQACRKEFLAAKHGATTIQAFWRGYVARSAYRQDLHSVILCQAVGRRFLCRRKFLRQRWAALTLQRAVRSWWMAKRDRAVYLQTRKSAVAVQCLWKMLQAQRQFLLQKKSVIALQARVRCHLERRRFLRQKTAAVTIQRWYRAVKTGIDQRIAFQAMKVAAVKIQAAWRMMQCRRSFVSQRTSAVTLQAAVRAHLARKSFLRTKKSCIALQQYWRNRRETSLLRKQFIRTRSSAVTIQSTWRGYATRRDLERKRRAAIGIQRHFRGYMARRSITHERMAAVTIQRAFRAHRTMKAERDNYLRLRQTVICMQTYCRSYLARQRAERLRKDAEYREQLRQEMARLEAARQEDAARKITRAVRIFLIRRRVVRRVQAAVVIQKFWRGTKARREMFKWIGLTDQLREIRERLSIVTATAKPEDRLGARTASAIDYLFSIKDVSDLICAVKTLYLSTRFSESCCRQIAVDQGNGPLEQLVNLMNRCNRSVPHMEVVSNIMDVLINISRVESTRPGLVGVEDLIQSLFQLMVVYRDNGPTIFGKICALLQILSCEPEIRQRLREGITKKKLIEHENRIATKNRLKEQNHRRRTFNMSSLPPTSLAAKKGPASVKKEPSTTNGLPNARAVREGPAKTKKIRHEVATGLPWGVDTLPRFHEDPHIAITSLMTVLELEKPKK